MTHEQGQLIAAVQAESIASELELRPGDRLLAIDNVPVSDIFDYRTRTSVEALVLTIRKSDGELLLLDIEKDEYEDLGLDFANPMLDDCRNCHNRCVFCFIDQLPAGMRSSLYLKDDDLRLSFLTGNYVTLTNISEAELDRIIEYRFSPLNISVHATDPTARRRLMRNRHAGELMPAMRRIASAGIRINAQIVLVPDYNDGAVLQQTLSDLSALLPQLQSIAIVPVGITRYREQNDLTELRAVSAAEAQALIELTAEWQQRFLQLTGSRTVYAADEFYLTAGTDLPLAAEYEDFPQLENGVGMISLFRQELSAGLNELKATMQEVEATNAQAPAPTAAGLPAMTVTAPAVQVLLITGTAAGPLLSEAASRISTALDLNVEALPVVNRFFGETITVAGLLTGQDVLAALQERLNRCATSETAIESTKIATIILIPECMLRAGTDCFLDDLTIPDLALSTGCEIRTARPEASALIELLACLAGLPANTSTKQGNIYAGSAAENYDSADNRNGSLSTAERPDSLNS